MQLYTIGHSTYPVDHFLELIRKYNIQYVIDVRSIPYSRFASQYNSEVLKKDLRGINVEYFRMDKSFGARQTDIRYYNSDGYLDFELFRKSDAFIKGVQNIIKGLKQYNIALMCTEKKPIDCHRAIMVARRFELHGVSVQHILNNTVFEPNGYGTYNEDVLTIQPENYYTDSQFIKVDRKTINDVMSLEIETGAPYIFSDGSNYLSKNEAIRCNHSLEFIKAENLVLYPVTDQDTGGYKAHYKARFTYNGIHYDNITVTDPEYDAGLTDFDGLVFGETYLVVSLGEEFRGNHYKLIAKIFDLVYTIENNPLIFFHAFRDCRYLERYPNVIYALWDDQVRDGKTPCKECKQRLDG